MQEAQTPIEFPYYAFHILVSLLKHGKTVEYPATFPDVSITYHLQISCPLFVTWKIRFPEKDTKATESEKDKPKKEDDDKDVLRGCIGTFAKDSLKKNLGAYAMISAFRDTRFSPIELREVPFLNCSVSLLQNFEPIKDPFDWVIGKHGIQIKFQADGNESQ